MYAKPIYVIDGARTPFLKAKNRPGVFSAGDLATQAGRVLLARQKFAPTDLDEVILGCAAPSVDEVNIGRVIARPFLGETPGEFRRTGHRKDFAVTPPRPMQARPCLHAHADFNSPSVITTGSSVAR